MYAKYIKRILDIVLSFFSIIVLSPFLLIFAIIGAIAMRGNPFFFQLRPGKDEKIFKMIKFRTMTCEKDKHGDFLPDEDRLTGYGRFLRATSIDELPELFNILLGQMSIVGPRPQLVRDMVFMTERQRLRHTVRPGLSGLAQISGRNAIDWHNKFEYDLEYIENITFLGDAKIVLTTILKILKVIHDEEMAEETEIVEDYGDYLLRLGELSNEDYSKGQEEALNLLEKV